MKKQKETVTVTQRVFKVLGYTEDVQVCGCCGREDLKGTVALEIVDTTEVVYYGVVCAGHAAGWTKKHTEELVKQSVIDAKIKASAEIHAHPVYAEHEAFMAETDKELSDINRRKAPYEEWAVVVARRMEMGRKLEAVKEEIRKKHLLKYL